MAGVGVAAAKPASVFCLLFGIWGGGPSLSLHSTTWVDIHVCSGKVRLLVVGVFLPSAPPLSLSLCARSLPLPWLALSRLFQFQSHLCCHISQSVCLSVISDRTQTIMSTSVKVGQGRSQRTDFVAVGVQARLVRWKGHCCCKNWSCW